MGCGRETVTVFSPQAEPVLKAIEQDGICFSREAYVQKKYGESPPIFLTAYRWYVKAAQSIVPRPDGAEFPYWGFTDPRFTDASAGGSLLTLKVPADEVVFFRPEDWNKILCLSLIGENDAEEAAFRSELNACGLHTTDVMLTSFYPDWKHRISDSWPRLFRFHQAFLSGESDLPMQAGLWRIKKEWIQ